MSRKSDKLNNLPDGLKRDKIPNHVAIIMDGNGRWAKLRGKPRVSGHRAGMDSLREVIQVADEIGIKTLSLYAFSEENWGRPKQEVKFILSLLNSFIIKESKKLHKNSVQFRVIGDVERLPLKTQRLIQETQELMKNNSGLYVNVALSYSSQTEILDACRNIANRVSKGEISPDEIDKSLFESALDTYNLESPDLLIRTSGEQRLSNFMLWQLAYSELYFPKTLWPDFKKNEFIDAILEFQTRNRRFGLVNPTAEQKSGLSIC